MKPILEETLYTHPRDGICLRLPSVVIDLGRSQKWERVKRWNELMLNEPHIAVTDLHKIQAPALIMGGDDDEITPEHLIEIYRNIPKAHLAILPGATHFNHQKQYERYNSIAERFLREPFTRPTARQEIENERF